MTGQTAAGSLSGLTVVVTRTRDQASSLVERLVGHGASVVELPVIAIEDAADGGDALRRAVGRAVDGAYDWLAFTSTNAVSRFVRLLDGRPVPESTRVAAVGAGTARVLRESDLPPALVPSTSVSEALVDAFPSNTSTMGPPSPTPTSFHNTDATTIGASTGKVLFVRAETVRGVLADGLRAKGWVVDEVVAYRTVAGAPDPSAVAEAARADTAVFTSSSTVERTVDLLGASAVPSLIASIGPVTSAAVVGAGLQVTVEATEHNIDGLVDALVGWYRYLKEANG